MHSWPVNEPKNMLLLKTKIKINLFCLMVNKFLRLLSNVISINMS